MGIRGTDIYGQEVNWNLYALTKMNPDAEWLQGCDFSLGR